MPDERLGVIIETEIGRSASDLAKVEKSIDEIGRSTTQMARQSNQAFTQFNKGAQGAAQALSRTATSAGRNGQAMNALNNIVRDLPFGFIAIQNNITQAADALLGFGVAASAISFGLSIVVTGVTALIQKYGSLQGAVEALTLSTNYQKKAQEELNSALTQGRKDAQEDIINTKRLFDIAKNVTLTMDQRVFAVKKLKEEFPQYAKDLDQEALLTGRATGAYNKLVTSLLASARARALAQRAAENAAKDIDLEEKGLQIAQRLAEVNQEIADRQAMQKRLAGTPGSGVSGRDAILLAQRLQLEAQLNDTFRARTAIIDQNTKIQGQLATTTDDIKLEKKTKEAKEMYTAFDGLERIFGATAITMSNFNRLTGGGFGLEGFTKLQNDVVTATLSIEKQLTGFSATAQAQLNAGVKPIEERLTRFAKNIRQTMQEGVVDTLANTLLAAGEAVSNGNFGAILSAFTGSISNVLMRLGTTLIATGIGIEAFKTSLESLQGIPAIIAGTGLVIAAAAFRSVATSSFATGGTAVGPQLAMIGDNTAQKEHILSDQQLFKLVDGRRGAGTVNVVGIIKGRDIHLANTRYGNELNRFS